MAPGVAEQEGVCVDWMYLTMWKMFEGVEERVMMVVTPAEVARRAAMSLVAIPPVPTLEPAVETEMEMSIDVTAKFAALRVTYRQHSAH